jgi:16S rRNA (uracil1498-N3)-methyltransferase
MPDYDFRAPRLFVADPLQEGSALQASAEQANYLGNVLRLSDGARVLLFNGRDGEWATRLVRHGKRNMQLVPEALVRAQTAAGDLHYLFAPLKHARLDYMVQKAVEMGASTLQPVMTQHCQAPRINTDRMRANAIEAAEQCGILTVPDCADMVRLPALIEGWDPQRALIFCDERAAAGDLSELLRPLANRPKALLIGPEGGFSSDERNLLSDQTYVTRIPLGPRILRADTAAVAALTVVQAMAGDWRL